MVGFQRLFIICVSSFNLLCIEPGYYEAEFFGIRLETDLEVVRAKTEYSMQPILKFDALTLVPFERKLIDECVLTVEQVFN